MIYINPTSIIVQAVTECNKSIYQIDNQSFEVLTLRAKIYDVNGNLIDYDFRINEELVKTENLLDKKTFVEKYYLSKNPFKLECDFQYNQFSKKLRIIVHKISSISLDKQKDNK
ncbi:MAG TPA: hypothetical protein DCS12_09845 [Clostridiales bacterium]|nr:hypothetical protein [Clostridiales bacterium]